MIYFYSNDRVHYFLVDAPRPLTFTDHQKLSWLFSDTKLCSEKEIEGYFLGPRREMITPWSTNAVEITQNMGVDGIVRIEEFFKKDKDFTEFDPMLQQMYNGLGQDTFTIAHEADSILYVEDIDTYNEAQSLALSPEEVKYLKQVSEKIGRKLTDSEIYGFAQINSEHCRHKIFNGTFIIDGKEMPDSLFALIKKTSKESPRYLVSAYKDNVAFIKGPQIDQFAPSSGDNAAFFEVRKINSVLSLKAETHNFPTTVEPFNGAATGSGGEIRDRMAGGRGSVPLAGTAVYMTSYPRLGAGQPWENKIAKRKWLYHTPAQILIKASNGASDFGNKFGQPLINGSLFTFEHQENDKLFAFDKVIMLAGGVGYANARDAEKAIPEEGDIIVVLGGDNYRIGMGGGAVSSVDTGEYSKGTELNAVQRSNPEMQKRTANAIRACIESHTNPIISIHDHGAGGHLNCLSELVEDSGAVIDIKRLPVGDPTLSFKEILGNESQERMGIVIKEKDFDLVSKIASRERSPIYKVGTVKADQRLVVTGNEKDLPVDLNLEYLFGKPPKTVLTDQSLSAKFIELEYDLSNFEKYLNHVLHLEGVACKDWLTNKVDRSVGGKVAMQQCTGVLQLPLNNLGIMALDYNGERGIATALGHAPAPALLDPEKGSRLAVVEALTNLVWAPIENGLSGVSLSANWMWPAKNSGENERLYSAVKALSDFSVALGIPVPTGKDSLSMTQKYPDGQVVYAPGTVIVSAVGGVTDIKRAVTPYLKPVKKSRLIYIDFSNSSFALGGSSLAQVLGKLGKESPDASDADYVRNVFNTIQHLILQGIVLAGHDVSSGGLITTLLEMNFPNVDHGMKLRLDRFSEKDFIRLMFSEKPAVVIQVRNKKLVKTILSHAGINYKVIGRVSKRHHIAIRHHRKKIRLDIDRFRDVWRETSYLLDAKQTAGQLAHERFQNYKKQDLYFQFNRNFTGRKETLGILRHQQGTKRAKAAIIREKGVNGDREMAYALYLAGFDVKDVHMTDLISGREDLSDIGFITFVGGFSNSDVLGSAKGWAGAFLYNPKAKKALDNFYKRKDTLSLGVCNGCQLMTELNLIYPGHPEKPVMLHNDSGKFESAFVNINIHESNSVMLQSLAGSRLGAWIAHGEGKFSFPYFQDKYQIPVSYSYDKYPGNPNGSDFATAAICSNNGRHLAIMPHLERSIFPWQWAYYPENRQNDQITPWMEAFVNARNWLEAQTDL